MRVALSMLVILTASTARADELAAADEFGGMPWAVEVEELPSPDEPGEARTDVAAVHSLALMTVMRTAEAAIWPTPFADVDPLTWAGRYGDALRHEPRWEASAAPFEGVGESSEVVGPRDVERGRCSAGSAAETPRLEARPGRGVR